MLPQEHAHIVEKQFEIVGPTFSNTIRELRRLFLSVWIAFIFRKLAEFFIYKRSLVITEAVCCDIFESFAMVEKQKSHNELYAN